MTNARDPRRPRTPPLFRERTATLVVIALGILLWATMTLFPLLRAGRATDDAHSFATSTAVLVLTFIPLPCLIFGVLRQERILYQFLFPILLLATQFGTSTTGWDEPIQYVPNGIVFALFFIATSFLGSSPARASASAPATATAPATAPAPASALAFLPHAFAVLSLAIVLALVPAWDDTVGVLTDSTRSVDATSSGSLIIPFASVGLAFAAVVLHVGRAFQKARELTVLLRVDPRSGRNRWSPTRRRVLGTLVILAMGATIGLASLWVR